MDRDPRRPRRRRLWARRTLKGGKRERKVEAAPARELTYEDKVDAEMRRITDELARKQGRT